MTKTMLTISRKWDNPLIKTTVSIEGISVEVDLDDFIEAVYRELDIVTPLAEEIGSITWVFTNEAFKQKLDSAIENVFKYQLDDAVSRVITDIKKETAKVI